ncbi:MAG TPA: caspase family protein, partial [Polyangia bacterium]
MTTVRMRRWLVGALLMMGGGMTIGLPTSAAEATPARLGRAPDRVALIVGNNVGHDRRRSLRYAEGEVVRLGELLERAGDFKNVEVLRAQTRSEVEGALVKARHRLEASKRAGRETLFLFYYSGHANGEALELGATRLPLRDLRSYLEQMPADVRLGFIDACQSGALTGVKGGRRAPGYEVRLADTANVKGLAIVTSSTANEFSQESDDLRGSYFSHNLMAGLQGLADSSGDGRITLS